MDRLTEWACCWLRPYFMRFSVAAKINLAIAAILLMTCVVSMLLVGRIASNALLDAAEKRGTSLAMSLSARSVEPILAVDFLRLKNMVDDTISSSQDVTYAFVLDDKRQVLAHTFHHGFPVDLATANPVVNEGVRTRLLALGNERVYDFAAPIILAGNRLGSVHVGLSQRMMQAARSQMLLAILAAIAGVAVVSLAIGTFFARTLTRRINILRDSAEEVVKGDLNVQTGPRLTRNCWEIMSCDLTNCPAYGDTRRRCWYLAGTLCPSCNDGEYEDKIDSCRDCPVYRENMGDEIQALAEAFDVMAITLRTHIEELTDAQKSLARQQQLLRSIFDVTPDLVSLQDEHLAYRAVNKAFCRYFNLHESQILGRVDFSIFSIQSAQTNRAEDREILASGKPLSKEIMVSKEQAKRWFHIVKVPVWEEERIIGLLMTARDISVVKNYQEQLIQSQKMEDLGRLAGGVAHEINTPLGIILGYSQMLLEDVSDDAVKSDLKMIEKQTKVCKDIVSDLLGFSRQSESSMAPMDLNASIEEVIDLVGPIFKQERVEVETDLDPTIGDIEGDREKLKSVWLNLVNNAFDAIGEDGTIYIRTKLCKHRRRVVLFFADTGSGISQDNLKKIFDPFFTTKQVGKGTGLGLSIAFGIINDHKGRISAVSPAPVDYLGSGEAQQKEPGPGTVFIIELPLTGEGLPDDECEDIQEVARAAMAE